MGRAAWRAALYLALALSAASAAQASTTRYFYDSYGRYIGLTSTGIQVRSNIYDAADNRSYYQLLVPNNPTPGQGLGSNQSAFQGQPMTSGSGVYTLILQEDGNLVLYHGSAGLWSSNSFGTTGATLLMQQDGDLALYDAQWNRLWHSNTSGNNGATLSVQSDGNVVIYASNGQTPLWSTGTSGR